MEGEVPEHIVHLWDAVEAMVNKETDPQKKLKAFMQNMYPLQVMLEVWQVIDEEEARNHTDSQTTHMVSIISKHVDGNAQRFLELLREKKERGEKPQDGDEFTQLIHEIRDNIVIEAKSEGLITGPEVH